MISDKLIKEIEMKARLGFRNPSCHPKVIVSPLTAMALLKEIKDLRKIAEAFIAAYNEPVHLKSDYNQLIDYVKEAYDQWCEAK